MTSEQRPNLEAITSAKEFRRWYWLKAELVAFCRTKGISASGSKFDLADRIAVYLDTGEVQKAARKKARSTFDWTKSPLSLETVITDNVSFGKNFRGFMTAQVGPAFVCHSDFMDWVKRNEDKTLADAVAAWQRLEARKEDSSFKRDIAPHNMLNQYTRDFFADNPGKTRAEMMVCWNRKKKRPHTGRVVYHPSDLLLED